MGPKESLLTSDVIVYIWVMGVSLWGGLVSFLEKDAPFTWAKLFAHLTSASFAGLMTYYLCQASNVPEPLTGVFCGLAAHMGTPALMRMKIIRQFLDKGEK